MKTVYLMTNMIFQTPLFNTYQSQLMWNSLCMPTMIGTGDPFDIIVLKLEIFSDFGKRRFKIQKPSVIGWNGMFFIMITNLIMLRNKPICNFVNARLNHLLPNALNAWFDLPSMLTKTNFFNRFMKIFHNLL